MADFKLTDAVFEQGQNEGIERAVLPLPQLAYVQNARQRKSGRWGKRWGTVTLPTVNRSGTALGSGTGLVRTCGAGFVTVDDQCAVYDSQSNAWVDPRALAPVNSSSLSYTDYGRIPGVTSGWQPDVGFFPVPPKSQQNQQAQACATAYYAGVLWNVMQFADPITPADQMLRVVATDSNQTVVFETDFRASVAGQGGLLYPKLCVQGTGLVLTYLSRLAGGGASAGIVYRKLVTVAGGFGAAAFVVSGVPSDTFYDAVTHSFTDLLVAYRTGTTTITALLFDPNSGTMGANQAFTDLGVMSSVSCTAANGLPCYITYGTNNGSTTHATRVKVWNNALTALVGTATVSTQSSNQGYATLLPAGGVRCVFGYTLTASNEPLFYYRDVSATAVAGTVSPRQWRAQPITRPVTIGANVYVWTTNTDYNYFGYATLLRLPAVSEFPGTLSLQPAVSCPVEMSVQDYLVATNPPSIDGKGLPMIVQIGNTASYAAAMPVFVGIIPDIGWTDSHELRVVQAKHFTDQAGYRSVMPVAVDGVQLVPGGALQRVDARGCVESGFFAPPVLVNATKTTGGSLTPSSSYLYQALYRAQNANGLYEVSGVSNVLTVNLGASDTKVSFDLETLEMGARENVQLEIYRSQANGQTLQLLAIVDGGLNKLDNGSTSYVDTIADSTIASRRVIYTQVGKQLSNCTPPPCRFGVLGGQRVFLGGLLRGKIVHASKTLLGDQSPTWCDNDAFRIVFPEGCTGLAWMDNLVGFSRSAIYVVSGDGPDDDGNGAGFSPPVRLPFQIGCVEPRSVVTLDEGTFFQSNRGLYLLPRGFGTPIAAGDVVMDTLAKYPIITGFNLMTRAGEQTVRWTCVNGPLATDGAQIVYDLVHKSWSVDVFPSAFTACGQWFDDEVAMSGGTVASASLAASLAANFADGADPIKMVLRTGDVRPFGTIGHGMISRVAVMAELRSACTLSVERTTDRGDQVRTRTFTGALPDGIGKITYTEAPLGAAAQRDVTALSLELSETSVDEGLAFIGLTIEHEATAQGLRLQKDADRVA